MERRLPLRHKSTNVAKSIKLTNSTYKLYEFKEHNSLFDILRDFLFTVNHRHPQSLCVYQRVHGLPSFCLSFAKLYPIKSIQSMHQLMNGIDLNFTKVCSEWCWFHVHDLVYYPRRLLIITSPLMKRAGFLDQFTWTRLIDRLTSDWTLLFFRKVADRWWFLNPPYDRSRVSYSDWKPSALDLVK